jgi:hypothetical protein
VDLKGEVNGYTVSQQVLSLFKGQKPPCSSYPRKRVSSSSAAAWIPAFAGMTKTYSELVLHQSCADSGVIGYTCFCCEATIDNGKAWEHRQ